MLHIPGVPLLALLLPLVTTYADLKDVLAVIWTVSRSGKSSLAVSLVRASRVSGGRGRALRPRPPPACRAKLLQPQ